MSTPVITIDGPSGVGKGTIARMLVQRLQWHFLDSGAIYRMAAWAVKHHLPNDVSESKLSEFLTNMPIRFEMTEGDDCDFYYDNQCITEEIRTQSCAEQASKLAVMPVVREGLLACQKQQKRLPGLVADGRDMGTVVFPDATIKIFLDASSQVRAERRYYQLKKAGKHANLETIFQEVVERDKRDRQRVVAPLRPAQDAHCIDTSDLTVEAVFAQIWQLVLMYQKKGGISSEISNV